MTTSPARPFSARTGSEKARIDSEFPAPGRAGLLHLLNEAVDRNYVAGWHTVAREARRIARAPVRNYQSNTVADIKAAQEDTETYLNQMSWDRVFDFCERLHSQLAAGYAYEQDGETINITTKAQAQVFVAEEMQRLFDEEGFAYEFSDGAVERRGKRHTVDQAGKATKVLADLKLEAARRHFSKALRYFRDRHKPDYENAVKEAVCAVESAAKELYPEAKAATLADFIKWSTGNERKILSKALGQMFTGLYAFRNSAEGVSHGSTSGDVVTAEVTEYVLAVAASQVLLMADLVAEIEEPPF
jgi:AbiJ N-terminal domain 4